MKETINEIVRGDPDREH